MSAASCSVQKYHQHFSCGISAVSLPVQPEAKAPKQQEHKIMFVFFGGKKKKSDVSQVFHNSEKIYQQRLRLTKRGQDPNAVWCEGALQKPVDHCWALLAGARSRRVQGLGRAGALLVLQYKPCHLSLEQQCTQLPTQTDQAQRCRGHALWPRAAVLHAGCCLRGPGAGASPQATCRPASGQGAGWWLDFTPTCVFMHQA